MESWQKGTGGGTDPILLSSTGVCMDCDLRFVATGTAMFLLYVLDLFQCPVPVELMVRCSHDDDALLLFVAVAVDVAISVLVRRGGTTVRDEGCMTV